MPTSCSTSAVTRPRSKCLASRRPWILRTAAHGQAKIIQVQETSVKAPDPHACTAAQLLIELSTVVIGTLYLILSENIEELILNVVAVNFVTPGSTTSCCTRSSTRR